VAYDGIQTADPLAVQELQTLLQTLDTSKLIPVEEVISSVLSEVSEVSTLGNEPDTPKIDAALRVCKAVRLASDAGRAPVNEVIPWFRSKRFC
jgi:hypothetical protein